MPNKIDLTNQLFGHWTALREDTARTGKNSAWICRCACGRETSVMTNHLRRGSSKSCGKCGLVPHPRGPALCLTFQGKTATLAEWGRITGLSYNVLAGRLQRGWPAEEILSTAPHASRMEFRRRKASEPLEEAEGLKG